MGKVLIAYFSATGTTEKMAEYIAEGVRFSEQEAVVKEIGDIKDATELTGYDSYIFGSPTYSQDLPKPVQRFLSTTEKVNLEGKMGGAFGSYKHDAYAPAIIFDILQNEYSMKPFELGSFNLKEEVVETSEGMKTCQDYGRVFGEKLGS
ncbi:flavodoxin family protein [Chloroflexota bacterium]